MKFDGCLETFTGMDKPVAIFLIGIPASGKTTFAEKSEYNDYIKISSDEYIMNKARLTGISYEDAFRKYRGNIKRYVESAIKACVNTEQSFILDQTNTYKEPRAKKLSFVPDSFHKKAIVFDISYRDAVMRADIRFKKTNKFISHKVIEDFHKNFTYPSYEEGFNEIIEIKV